MLRSAVLFCIFSEKSIEKWKLDAILQAGHLAPIACNRQPQRIFVIQSENMKEVIYKSTRCKLYFDTAFLVCWDRNDCWIRSSDGKFSGEIDASIVLTHMMLEAADLDIGSICVMSWDVNELKNGLSIPENYEPTALLLLGYAADGEVPYPGHTQFRSMDETIFYV